MAVTRINNNQITDASAGNLYLGINASTKLQNYSITATKLANGLVYGSDLTISGNLTVDGTTTAVNTVNTIIEDPLIVLADGQTSGAPTVDIGIIGLRGSELNSVIAWKEGQKEFVTALSNTDAGGTSFSNTVFNINTYANLRTGNFAVEGTTSLIGNVIGTNTNFSGNITAANFFGNVQGNLVIGGANTDVLFNDNGIANSTSQFRFDKSANLVTMTGALSVAGTATVGNVDTGGTVSATGTVTGGNLATGGTVSATGTATLGNVATGGTVSATGTITGGNLATSGTASAGGNVTGANILTSGLVSATGDIFGRNVTANGNIIPAANVQYDIGATSARWTRIYAQGPIHLGNLQVKESPTNTFTVTLDDSVTPANVTLGPLTVQGNVDGGNLRTNGQVSATGTVTGGNINTAGTASVAGTATVGNVATAGTVSATGNITTDGFIIANSAIFSQNISLTGNVTVFNVNVLGRVSATGNVIGGNISTANTVTAGGNIDGGNVNTTGQVSASSTITGGNLATGGTASAAGTITGGNLATGGTVSATGNITTGSYLVAPDASIGNISASNVNTGNVAATNTISATSTITGGNIATGGTVSATSTITGGNIDTGGNVSATGTVTGGNIATGGTVSATGTITGGNLATGGTASVAGTITGGNVDTGGTISATGTITSANTITGGNLATGGTVSAGGNITGANVLTGGVVSATGNITGANVNTAQLYNATGLTITNGAGNINLYPAGNLVLANTYVNGVAYPVQNQDAASKIYVDNLVTTSISYHEAVVAATITTLDTATGGTVSYNQPNGAGNGQGAYLQTTGSFTTIDTANIATVGTRILVKNEANAAWNGIYTYSNTTAIVRSTSEDTPGTGNAFAFGLNDYFFTTNGNINKGTAFIVDAPTTPVVFGTSLIEFAIFSQTQVYSANTAAGLVLNGTEFSAKVDNNTTAFDGGGNIIVKASANLTTPNIGAATGTSLSTTGTITGGNLVTGGLISATGDITGYNITALGNIVAGNITGNVQGNLIVPGANTQVVFNDNGVANATSGFTFDKTTSTVTAGNLVTGGTITATGTITGGNVATGGTVSATSTVTGGNIATGGTVSATGNITGGNAIATGGFFDNISVTANVTTGNLITSGSGGNITGGGNIIISGYISTTSSVVGGSIQTAGTVSATGTITGGNINTAGVISATGTATLGNVATGGVISATGNITTAAWLVAPNAAIGNISLSGNIDVANVNVSANVSAAGNVTGANILTGGRISAIGTITGGNLATGGTVSATGDITGANISASGTIFSASTANVGNLVTQGIVSASGDVTGGNLLTGGLISSTGNISSAANIGGANLNTSGNVSAIGNVIAANFIGNISGNLSAPGANTDVIFNDNGTANATGGFTFNKTSNAVTIGGNATVGNLATGGQVSATGTVSGSYLYSSGEVSATGNVVASGNVNAVTNFVNAGAVLASGRVEAGTTMSATGNITGANLILTTGYIDGPSVGRVTVNGSSIDTDFAVNSLGGANVFYVDAGTATASFGNSTQTVNSIVSFNSTNSVRIPVGNTVQRPAGATGQMRFNTTINAMEVYNNSQWVPLGATEFTLITDQQFNGDGSTLTFTLSANATTAGTIVSINGVQQIPTTAYAVTADQLTFTEAPAIGDLIDVRNLITTTQVYYIANSNDTARVGVSDGSNIVSVTGTMSVTGNVIAQNFINSSDERLKGNITPITTAGTVVDGLQGVGYDWNDGSGHAYGFIAQAVEQVLPEAVVTDKLGMKSVNYNMVIPFLIERAKEQSREIAELRAMVEQLAQK